jgi:Transglycosylase-like domain
MTAQRAGAPAIVRRSKPVRSSLRPARVRPAAGSAHPGSRAERRATRRLGRQVRGITAAVLLGIALSAAGFAARPVELPAGSASASAVSARRVDLSHAQNIAAKRDAIARPVEGVLLTHAVTQEEQMRAAAAAAAARAAKLARHTNVDWDGIAACETGGNWHMQGSTYSGGVGFANSTWSGFGGREFAPNAGMASREEQIVVAERVYARYGLSGWGCRHYG